MNFASLWIANRASLQMKATAQQLTDSLARA
jgi:hypothetical protein